MTNTEPLIDLEALAAQVQVEDIQPQTTADIPDRVYPEGLDTPEQKTWWDKFQKESGERQERRRERRESKPRKPLPPKPRAGALVKPLTEFYGSLGMMVVAFDQPCGMAIIANAEQCARSLDNMARENETMRRVLLMLVETSTWGTVIAAHMPILMAIAAHHIPAVRTNMEGIPIPSMPTQTQNGDE